ncbi:MAG: double-strand break repair protein AddB [Micavibrio sp.]|nr:double-strand break repair protein AddB [Micavibrio sp.]
MSAIIHQNDKIFTIPPTKSFADSFTHKLLKETEDNVFALTQYLILLPTRRACRIIRESFLRQTEGKPLLLPRLQAIGDIDEDELLIGFNGGEALECPPAISAVRRQAYLAQIISKLPDFSKSPAHDLALANALGQLLDQIYTEDLDIAALPSLVDTDKFAKHWQVTLDFLKIISEHWPKILNEIGMIDIADRRNRLLNKLNEHWVNTPPQYTVIAAGTTGSIPSTTKLLKTILTLPQGRIVLPGLDPHIDDNAWSNIDESHPQSTLKNLLNALELERSDIKTWPDNDAHRNNEKEEFISNALTPADNTDSWQSINPTKKNTDNIGHALCNTHLYECNTLQEEATLISLIMRESLEHKEKITAVITPDRTLAKRITKACKRWDIIVDDSAGKSLIQSAIGSFILQSGKVCLSHVSPITLLSFLKHPFNTGGKFKDFRKAVRLLDKQVLRGLKPEANFDGLIKKYNDVLTDKYQSDPNPITLDLLHDLKPKFEELLSLFEDNNTHYFSKFLKEHIKFIENFSTQELLWQGDEGEEAAKFLSELLEESSLFPKINGHDYLSILAQLMSQKSVRPKYGTHPRLIILGQLEARLIHADRVILASLNEGTWPEDSGFDPWMSRPMRQDFGLPPLERGIGLSANDFVHGFCKKEVFLTRSKRVDSSPTVPSRWLQRIDTLLKAYGLSGDIIRKTEFLHYLEHLDKTDKVEPIKRPAPTPDLSVRPNKLSVTAIDTWLKDPYSIYAKYVLNLKTLEPLEKEWSAIEKGNLLHTILERFNKNNKTDIPNNAFDQFITIAKEEFEIQGDENIKEFWFSKIYKIGEWYINHEKSWRDKATPYVFEEKGSIEIKNGGTTFTLSGRADRIDKFHDGNYAIIDYKTGGSFSGKGMISGQYPQLSLEGYILSENGFGKAGINDERAVNLSYWLLNGANPAGKTTALHKENDVSQAIENAEIGIKELVSIFQNNDTPYYAIPNLDNAPRFNDYEHLSRVKEWAALGDDVQGEIL